MPARYANRTCTVCGLRRPQPYMRQVIRKVNTGHSGMSASINPSKGFGSARLNSGRQYYRNRKVWECRDSDAHDDPGYYDRLRAAEEARQQEIQAAEEARQRKEAIKNVLFDSINNFLSRDWKLLIEKFQKTPEYKKIKDDIESEKQFNVIKAHISFDNYLINLLPLFTNETFDNTKLSRDSNERLIAENLGQDYINTKIIDNEVKEIGLADYISISVGFMLTTWLFIIENNMAELAIASYFAMVYYLYLKDKKVKEKKYGKFETLLQQSSDLFDVIKNSLHPYLRHEILYGVLDLNNSSYDEMEQIVINELYSGETKEFVTKASSKSAKLSTNKKTDNKAISVDSVNNYKITEIKKLSFEELTIEIFSLDNFFDAACYILLINVAKSDGEISQSELSLIMQELVELSNNEVLLCTEFMKRKTHFDLIIKLILRRYKNNTDLLEQIINNLFYVAEIDGTLTSEEYNLIEEIARRLGIQDDVFQLIKEDSLKIRGDRDFIDEYNIDDILDDIDEL